MIDSSFPLAVVPDISAAILSSSAVTRLGLACPDSRARQRAAEALALTIVERLGRVEADQDQLTLAL